MASVVVDGIEYAPLSEGAGPRIGVGVTTKDRNEQVAKTVALIKQYTPGAKVVVVDDASKTPVQDADHRFDKTVGIARAKNKVLELLHRDQSIEHFFLFDDDAWPMVDGWWKPYVESPEPHLMAIYDRPRGVTKRQVETLYEDEQHVAYHATRGYCLYAHRKVIDTVGGMDPDFGAWGWEHQSWSDRIHSAGLTTWRYADVKGSDKLIYSMDKNAEITSTATDEAKRFSNGPGLELRMESRNSGHFIEFRERDDVVMTALLTAQNDPQRGRRMKADPSMLEALRKSLKGDSRFVVLHTNLTDMPNTELVKVTQSINPYFERHLQAYQWLRDHPEVGRVWCVDGTDVEMLRDPFPEMEAGRLYLGYEPTTLRDPWMVQHHPDKTLQTFMEANKNLPLLNAGLIGGDREVVMGFLQKIIKMFFDDHIDWIFGWETARVNDDVSGDMGVLNYIARTHYADNIDFGPHVCTVFKSNETTNKTAWWKHK